MRGIPTGSVVAKLAIEQTNIIRRYFGMQARGRATGIDA